MTPPGDNHGSVSVLVTTDTSNVRAEISAALTKPFKTSIEVSKTSLNSARRDVKEALAAPFKISVELNKASATRVRTEIKEILGPAISINVKMAGDGKAFLAQVQKVEKQRVAVSLASDKVIQRNREKSLQKIAAIEKSYQARRKLLLQQDVNNENAANRSREGEAAKALERRARNEQVFRNKSALEAQKLNNRLIVIATRADARTARIGSGAPGLIKFGEGVQRVSNSLNGFERTATRALTVSLAGVTAWSAGVVAGFAAVGVAALKAVVDVEQSASRAAGAVASQKIADEIAKNGKATSNFGQVASAAQKKITAAATQIGLDTLFNTKEVSQGILSLVQSGQSLSDAITNVRSAAVAASVSGEDLGLASEGLAAGLASAGLNASQSAALLDKFQFVANDTLGNVGDVTDAFANKSAASFRAYHRSVDETLLVLDLLGKTGIKGANAGTAATIVIKDLSKAINNNGKEFQKLGIRIQDARHPSVTFAQTLSDLGKVFAKLPSNIGSTSQLGKALGFQQKSFQFIAQTLSQVQKLGEKGLNIKLGEIENSKGSVAQQFGIIQKQLFFQLDQLRDSFTAVFLSIGQSAAAGISKTVDIFAGNKGLVVQIRPELEKLGAEIGKIAERFGKFAQGGQFAAGIKNLGQAFVITIHGVAEAGKQLGIAFGSAKSGQSAFVGFTKAIKAFAEFSAATLPKVARVIGEIISFLVDHKDAFAAFAKGAVVVLVLKKAFDVFLSPALAAGKALVGVRLAMAGIVAEEGAGLAAGLGDIAASLGLVDKEALGAYRALQAQKRAAIEATAANEALAASNEALASSSAARAISSTGSPIVGAAAAGGFKKFSTSATTISAAASSATPEISGLSAALAGLGESAAAVAGAFALVTLAIPVAIGIFEGIGSQFKKEEKTNKDFAASMRAISSAATALGDAVGFAFGKLELAGKFIGENLVKGFGQFASGIGEIGRSFADADLPGVGKGLIDLGEGAVRGILPFTGPLFDIANSKVADFVHGVSEVPKATERLAQAIIPTVSALNAAQNQALLSKDGFLVASTLITGLGDAFDNTKKKVERVPTVFEAARQSINFRSSLSAFNAQMAQTALVATFSTDQISSGFRNINVRKAAGEFVVNMAQIGSSATSTANTVASAVNSIRGALAGIAKKLDSGNKRDHKAQVVAQAKQAAADAKTFNDAFQKAGGAGTLDLGTAGLPKTPAAAKLKDTRTAAEKATDAVNKLTQAQFRQAANPLIAKIQKLPGAYQATAFQAEILRRSLPSIDAALQKQRDQVTKLTDALTQLQSTQLKGTKAAADAAFGFDQDVKKLQLQKLDLQIGGVKDEDPRIKALDDQINAIQLKSERAATAASIALDPLKKKLEDTFTPVKELSFEQIIAQFNALNNQKIVLDAKVSRGDALKAKLDAVVAAAADKFTDVGLSVTKGINVGLKAGQDSVAKASASTANTIKSTIDSGLGIASPSKEMIRRGIDVTQGLTIGITEGRPAVLQAMRSLNFSMLIVIDNALPLYALRGTRIMSSFLDGIKQGFGTKKDVGSVAWYLGTFIPQWIIDNKGPIEADRQLLVPAGEAVMQGFSKGLRSGFGEVQAFVGRVGPTLSEDISADLFSERTAKFMAEIAIGNKPDIDALFGDLSPAQIEFGLGNAVSDPRLGFLHKTESAFDTLQMAQSLAKTFGGGLRVSATTNHSRLTSSGNVSDHVKGWAADISNGVLTPQEDALAAALKPLFGTIIKQLIWRDKDQNRGFVIPGHQNHVHVAFLPAPDFDFSSRKVGTSQLLSGIGSGLLQGPQQTFKAAGEPLAIAQVISRAAGAVGVNVRLLTALVKAESGFNPRAGSPAGAFGLTQLLRSTALGEGVTDIFDPFQNAVGGAKYLKSQLNRFHNVSLALAAYNAGPSAVSRYHGIPPYRETQDYVKKILGFIQSFGGFREKGGPVGSGTPYIVGERGPELFIPRSNGTVLSNTQTSQALSGSSGQINYAPNIVVHTAATDPRVTADLIDIYSRRQLQGVLR